MIPATARSPQPPSGPEPAPPPQQGASPPRRRVVRSETLDVAGLSALERKALAHRLHPVYAETVAGFSRREFDADVFGAEDTRIVLFYGTEGELAGFSYRRFDTVEQNGRRHVVIGAGVYFRLGYRGGSSGALFGLTESLRFKLRHPLTPLAYLTRSASPAVYRLLAGTMPRVYPHPHLATPDALREPFRLACTLRAYEPAGADPWVVRSIAVPTQPERLRKLQADPLAQYFLRRVPGFAEGDALLVWIPLDVANVLGALVRLARRRVRR